MVIKKSDRLQINLKQIFTDLNTFSFYLLIVCLGIYYKFSKTFVYESLRHLTPGRLEKLKSLPIHVSPTALDSLTIYVTLFLCIFIFVEFYNLHKGHLNQSKYNLRIQFFAFICFSPIISYFSLQILWLLQTDSSWDFDLDVMEAPTGWAITNQWPFDLELTDKRMDFYKTGIFNSVRVVIASIVLSTFLGIIIGVLRLSRNKLLSNLARAYVDLFRNLPLILQLLLILVWFVTTLEPFREVQDNNFLEWIFWSNQGFIFPKMVIENMAFFLLGIGILLLFRIYVRFSERIFVEKEEIELPHFHTETKTFNMENLNDVKANLKFLIFRPFYFLDKKFEPIIPDILFSLSILSLTFGIFRILEWNYSFSFTGVLDQEPFSLFVFGLILLFYSSKMSSVLELEGLNAFTEDSSPEAVNRRLQLTGAVFVSFLIFLYLSIAVTQPNLITEKDGEELSWGKWKFEDNTYEKVSSVFINLMIGLTLYTAAQIAEVVRGSIQSLPRGQIEAAISIGLSPYQRLKLVILPQALRSMVPALTNQYLNCWKNSSLALLIGFSDFYFILTTIVNNAGNAVPIFIMILLTYQAGSLLISAVMNNINNSVTKVKI